MDNIVSVGTIVIYTLNDYDAEKINKRRTDANQQAQDKAAPKNTGFQVHYGNNVSEGDKCPMIVTMYIDEGRLNGQVILDGNDTFWATSRAFGTGPGTWNWPK